MVGSTPPKPPGKSISKLSVTHCSSIDELADGAKIPIRLGFGDIGGVTGRYWGNPSIADTGYGQVMEW